MLMAALSELKINVSDFTNCHARQCMMMFQKKALDVLKIEWKPISVFPNEARRFK
jgi:hypothetical protein